MDFSFRPINVVFLKNGEYWTNVRFIKETPASYIVSEAAII